jgi:hypothetical protein
LASYASFRNAPYSKLAISFSFVLDGFFDFKPTVPVCLVVLAQHTLCFVLHHFEDVPVQPCFRQSCIRTSRTVDKSPRGLVEGLSHLAVLESSDGG